MQSNAMSTSCLLSTASLSEARQRQESPTTCSPSGVPGLDGMAPRQLVLLICGRKYCSASIITISFTPCLLLRVNIYDPHTKTSVHTPSETVGATIKCYLLSFLEGQEFGGLSPFTILWQPVLVVRGPDSLSWAER